MPSRRRFVPSRKHCQHEHRLMCLDHEHAVDEDGTSGYCSVSCVRLEGHLGPHRYMGLLTAEDAQREGILLMTDEDHEQLLEEQVDALYQQIQMLVEASW